MLKQKRTTFIDVSGRKYGELTALYRVEGKKPVYWMCDCKCGTRKAVYSGSLSSGRSKSCGCGERENLAKLAGANRSHGMTSTNTYHSWNGMKSRCLNQKNAKYKDYGGRGITVCKRWMSFNNFIADMGVRPEGFSIDRIDNNAGYNPENCRWATRKEQANNQRVRSTIPKHTFKGRTLIISDWAKEVGIDRTVLCARLRRGWSMERTLTEPVEYRKCRVTRLVPIS